MHTTNKHIMALDAAFGQASACLLRADGISFHATGEETLPHSQGILPLLEKLLHQAELHWQELEMLLVGIGPGSFTGLRVAAASIAGINTVLNLPLLTVSSLAVTALQTDTEEVWVLEDARSGDAYVGHYLAGRAVQPDCCLPWDSVRALPVTCHVSQSDDIVSKLLAAPSLPLTYSRPAALERTIGLMLDDSALTETSRYPTPAYIRPSQAERNASHG